MQARESSCYEALQIAKHAAEQAHQPFLVWGHAATAGMLHEGRPASGIEHQLGTASVEVTANVFESFFWPKCGAHTDAYSPSAVWTEIVSIIKGGPKSLFEPQGQLSRSQYQTLGAKIGRFGCDSMKTPTTSRDGVYTIFLEYEQWKARQEMHDRMDLVYHIYRRVVAIGYNGVHIHTMSIDEVQDFTQAELCLYMMITDPNDMLLAGDTCQTIARGVSFRFEDLRTLFYEANRRGRQTAVVAMPDLTNLAVNFRTHNGILRPAACIVTMLRTMYPGAIDALPKDYGYFDGSLPFVVTSAEDLSALIGSSAAEEKEVEFGARQVVLVRTHEAKKALPAGLREAICLTIFEAKGLEFDDVILYNFFSDSPATEDEWRAVTWYMHRHQADAATESANATAVLSGAPRPARDFEQRPVNNAPRHFSCIVAQHH